MKIAWRPFLGNTVIAAQVRASCEAALKALAELGAQVVEMPDDFEHAEQLWLTFNGAYRLAQFGGHLEKHRTAMDPSLVAQLERAAGYSAQELYRAIFMRTRLYRQVQGWFEHVDIVATPTLARTALPIDHDFFEAVEIDGRPVDTMRRAWYPYTLPFNLTGNPAISIPCGWDTEGLPIGLQLIRPAGRGRIAAAGRRAVREAAAVGGSNAAPARAGLNHLPSSFSIHSLPTLRSLIIALVAASNSRKWGAFRCTANAASSL